MGYFTGFIVFLLIWWTMLFTVLPWGLKRDETGKPDDPRLFVKFMATTGLSVLLWVIIYILIAADLVSFRDMANVMIEKDTAS